MKFRRAPREVYSLKQRYEDDGPDCAQLISERITKYGFKPGIIPPQRLAHIIEDSLFSDITDTCPTYIHSAEIIVDPKTYNVLSSLGFNVDNLMLYKDALPDLAPGRTPRSLIRFFSHGTYQIT